MTRKKGKNPYFSFAGMQRSGNHAVISWWYKHFKSHYFRNNILGLSYKDRFVQEDICNEEDIQNTHVNIDSWENYEPEAIACHPTSDKPIVILRDPYNWWASLFTFFSPNPNIMGIPVEGVIELYLKYIDYAKSFPSYAVNFNRWFQSSEYRRAIEGRWGLIESDEGINEVSPLCCGSSFDRLRLDGKAQEMDVLTRYKQVFNLPRYYEPLRKYPALADISREIFNIEPPETCCG